MYKYEVIVYWSEEDKAYIAEVPELPGCMSDGESYEEAIKNVQVIIAEWIETAKKLKREIPKPKCKLGLESLIARESSKRLAKLGGTEKKLSMIPRRRTG